MSGATPCILIQCGGVIHFFVCMMSSSHSRFIFDFLMNLLVCCFFVLLVMANVLLPCQTIDNPEVVGGEYVLSSLVYGNGSIPLTVSGILSNCSDNATIYVALQVDSVIDLDQLTDIAEVQCT